jgi:hypothetical protein
MGRDMPGKRGKTNYTHVARCELKHENRHAIDAIFAMIDTY